MTATEFRQALHALGLNQKTGAVVLGIHLNTCHGYAKRGPAEPAARLLQALLRLPKFAREDLISSWLGEAEGVSELTVAHLFCIR